MLQLEGTGPLHQQIYRAFRNEILSGALAPGERVPSTRALADLLKISRNTAISAYEQLLAEGYLETRLGSAGTVVAPVLARTKKMHSRLLFIISSHKIGLRLLSRILELAPPSEAKRLYMAIELTKEARQNAINSIQKYFEANLEERIGNLEANALLGFILEEIGPSIYNKGVADAQERMQARLSDLDYEVHEDEFQYWRNLERRQKGRK